jgi:hypothetical protein
VIFVSLPLCQNHASSSSSLKANLTRLVEIAFGEEVVVY